MTVAPAHPAQPIAIIGGGPAGLMAADILSAAGHAVDLYDAMPSVGRKFLLAGVGGAEVAWTAEQKSRSPSRGKRDV